jgi:oligopeptide/dipeptide ABC transporter ATP-binding protein
MSPLLEVSDLTVEVRRQHRSFRAVDGVSLSLAAGGSLGIVGESGSGKSMMLRAIMGLLPRAARVQAGAVRVAGEPVVAQGERSSADRRRHRLAIIFQDALSALDPVMTIGAQVAEAPRRVGGLSARAARERALELLRTVGVPDPAGRYDSYPHQLSGGLRQRVLIAIALSTEPAILLCDEPTTALDVTIQAQILTLLQDLREAAGLSIVFVTHDLGVVGQICDEIAVMYAGRLVETGPVGAVLDAPRHPYTAALLASAIDVDSAGRAPQAIPGAVPDPLRLPPGCPFQPRCPIAQPDCAAGPVPLHDIGPGRSTACLHDDMLVAGSADPGPAGPGPAGPGPAGPGPAGQSYG